MSANNTWSGVGYLGKDPELRYTPKQVAVATLNLAVSGIARDGAEAPTYWFNVKVFGKAAEAAAEILKKGSLVAIQGEIHTYTFEKDGEKRYGWEVKTESWRILGGGKQKDAANDDSQEEEAAVDDDFSTSPF